MSLFDWIQIALGIIRLVRRAIGRLALLFPWRVRAECRRGAKTVESTE